MMVRNYTISVEGPVRGRIFARMAEGRLVVTDPARLSGDMLVDYATATAGA